ncbi:MAG TPA: hypothetical protein VMD25_10785 [Acidobacteriaceae bacterium]|nr:hypothetical protein [Acidobacteriaceae bacterium]
MKGSWSSRLGVAALAAVMGLFAAAGHAQVVSPPPGATLPPPAPLAGVKYNYRWEIYGGLAYSHFDAGPNTFQGANLGGYDARAIWELSRRWGVGFNGRGYFGTSGVGATTPATIHGPFVAEYMFLGGPEVRLMSNEHAAMMLHGFFGGSYGDFQHDLGSYTPQQVGFFANQFAPAMALGGSIDLNRSPRLVFRIAPDALLTDYGNNGFNEQFAISVGVVYRMGHQFKVKQ